MSHRRPRRDVPHTLDERHEQRDPPEREEHGECNLFGARLVPRVWPCKDNVDDLGEPRAVDALLEGSFGRKGFGKVALAGGLAGWDECAVQAGGRGRVQ